MPEAIHLGKYEALVNSYLIATPKNAVKQSFSEVMAAVLNLLADLPAPFPYQPQRPREIDALAQPGQQDKPPHHGGRRTCGHVAVHTDQADRIGPGFPVKIKLPAFNELRELRGREYEIVAGFGLAEQPYQPLAVHDGGKLPKRNDMRPPAFYIVPAIEIRR